MPEKTIIETVETEKKPFLGLSLTQLVGGGAAAATAALLGSRLGTTGTIIGAGIASIISAIASALYTASIARTKQAVVVAREMLPTTMAIRPRDLPDVADQPEGTDDDVVEVDVVEDEGDDTASLWSRIRWGYVAIAAAAVFVVGALAITGIELVTGQSVSGGGRTTFGNAFDGSSGKSTPAPSKSPSQSPTTKDSGSTTPTESPSESPTQTPTTDPTETPTSDPTTQPTDGSSNGAAGGEAGSTATPNTTTG